MLIYTNSKAKAILEVFFFNNYILFPKNNITALLAFNVEK